MSLILQPHPHWSPEDKELTKQFFATQTWMKILEMVMAARPSTTGTTFEERGIGGIQRESIEDTINAFAQIPNFDKAYATREEFEQVDTSLGMGNNPKK